MRKNTLSDRGETQNIITFVGLYETPTVTE